MVKTILRRTSHISSPGRKRQEEVDRTPNPLYKTIGRLCRTGLLRCAAVTHIGDIDDVFHLGISSLYLMQHEWSFGCNVQHVVSYFANEVIKDKPDAFSPNHDDPTDTVMIPTRFTVLYHNEGSSRIYVAFRARSLRDSHIEPGATIFLVPNLYTMYDWSFPCSREDWRPVDLVICRLALDRFPPQLTQTEVDHDFGGRLSTANIEWPGGIVVTNGVGDGKRIYEVAE
jgi:hypothetical protein